MQSIDGLKKEFASLQNEEQGDEKTTIVFYTVNGELSNEDKEYMKKHPEYHYMIFQESDLAIL